MFKNVIYALERKFGKKIIIKKYHGTDIDYSDPQFNTSTESCPIKAIALPGCTSVLPFPRNQQGEYESYDRLFLMKIKLIPFDVVPQYCFIMFEGKRYDIKKLETFESIYYLASCKALGDEPDE